MADNRVRIIISATDLASREFQKLEKSIKRVQDESRKTGKQAKSTAGDMDLLARAGGYLAVAMGAIEIGKVALDLANLGESVRNTTNRFQDLVGGAAAAEASLSRMRQMTRYLADDTALMQGASDLLLMGVANTTQEAESIVELAIGLKRSTDTVADAINNFAIMMGNQSYLRLDSFGISAGRTRQRVEELLAAGEAVNREEAFAMAVLEIGQQTMDRTIDSIDRTSTAFGRLKTDVANAMDDIGKEVFTTTDAMARAFEMRWIDRTSQRFEDVMEQYRDISLRAATNFTDISLSDREQQLAISALAVPNLGREMANAYSVTVTSGLGFAAQQIAGSEEAYHFTNMLARLFEVPEETIKENADEIVALIERAYDPDYQRMLQNNQRYLAERERLNREAAQAELANARRTRSATVREAEALQAAVEAATIKTGPTGEIIFFDPDQMALVEEMFDSVQSGYEQAMEYADDLGTASVESLEDAHKAARDITREAQRAADAYNRISLTDLLSPQSSRLISDLRQIYVEGLSSQGLSLFEQGMDLGFGGRFELAHYLENDLIPSLELLGTMLDPIDALNLIADALMEIESQSLSGAAAVQHLKRVVEDSGIAGIIQRQQEIIRHEEAKTFDQRRRNYVRDYNFQRRALSQANRLLSNFEDVFKTGVIDERLFDPTKLTDLNQQFDIAIDSAEELIAAFEAGDLEGIVSDSEIAQLKLATGELQNMRDAALQGAEAFQNLSLSRLFGETPMQTSLQEIIGAVGGGLDPDLAKLFETEIQSLSGSRTSLTNFFESELTPLIQSIAERVGPTAGAQAAIAINEALYTGMRLGLTGEGLIAFIQEQIGVSLGGGEQITVNVPRMVTWGELFELQPPQMRDEDGNIIEDQDDMIEAFESALGLAEGSIELDKAIKVSVAGTEITSADIGRIQGLATEQINNLIFNNPDGVYNMEGPLAVNLHSTGMEFIMQETGMSQSEITRQLVQKGLGDAFTVYPSGYITIRPGLYTFDPFANIVQAPMNELGGGMQGGFDKMLEVSNQQLNWTTIADSVASLPTNLQAMASVDMTGMNSHLGLADDHVSSINAGLDLLTKSTWTIPVRVAFDASSVPENFRDSLQRAVQDNGGVTPGSRPGGR